MRCVIVTSNSLQKVTVGGRGERLQLLLCLKTAGKRRCTLLQKIKHHPVTVFQPRRLFEEHG